jgi:hypothetical protein
MEPAILQGVTQASVATGDKQSNPDSAGSAMSRRHIHKFITSNHRSLQRNISIMTWSHSFMEARIRTPYQTTSRLTYVDNYRNLRQQRLP